MKKENAITLISLVITIIVILILAAVSINLLLSNNGIITKSRDAKLNYELAANEEDEMLKGASDQIDSLVAGVAKKKDANGVKEGKSGYLGSDYKDPYVPAGFEHTAGTWNNGYTIKNTTTNDEFVWVPCTENGTDETVAYKTTNRTQWTDSEPLYMYNPHRYGLLGEHSATKANLIKTSAKNHGGFYIAKYEAGIDGTTDNYSLEDSNKKPTDGTYKPLSQQGKGVWNGITLADAIRVSEAMVNTTDGVHSTIISGEAWDTTLQWMVKKSDNASQNGNYDVDSTGKGYYNQESPTVTGSNSNYGVNGIYDMAGNLWEYTTEECDFNEWGDIDYTIRGGGLNNPSYYDYKAAAWRSHFTGLGTEIHVGFRVVLYK